ncbi:TetR family transcriptional regulator [Mesorhizobium sp. LjNodule214]|uniref:TetR family transcriptional regulator n=1 Tax=Mesorhizobium sp. LjNodule214 TaxID=3342252 RepID=UPI003ED0146A
MKHAGFTQGGFYNHFESKAALVAEVVASAMAAKNAELVKTAKAPVDESTTALRRIYRGPTATTSMTAALSPGLLAMLPAWTPAHSRISPTVWTIR